MFQSFLRIIVGTLFLLGLAGIMFRLPVFAQHREAFILFLEDTAQNLALPYHVARLSARPPDDKLPIPVQGVKLGSIVDTWGAPRGRNRTHEGVDIFAKRGTPVFSATHGYVVKTGTSTLGGNYVFVVGSGGVRYYYAHLDAGAQGIEFGKEVTTDTVLGYVGTTGNAEGTLPHLHFGMYKNGAQNPFPLLVPR